jgi:hypothetical protein
MIIKHTALICNLRCASFQWLQQHYSVTSGERKGLSQHKYTQGILPTLTAIGCLHSISADSFVRKTCVGGSVHCYALNAMVTHSRHGRKREEEKKRIGVDGRDKRNMQSTPIFHAASGIILSSIQSFAFERWYSVTAEKEKISTCGMKISTSYIHTMWRFVSIREGTLVELH